MTDTIDPLDTAVEYRPRPEPPPEPVDGLPRDFDLRDDGVYRRVGPGDGDDARRRVCSPIRVVALTHDRCGDGWGRLVEVTDPDGRVHRWAMPARLFAGDGMELRAALLEMGLRLSPGNWARTALSDLLAQWLPAARAITADRLGWTDETYSAFVLGDGRVLGDTSVVFQHENAASSAAEMRASGTPAEWRESVAALCIGNPLLVGAVSLAFAGPLLGPLGLDGGGLHLRGASSRGKSTAQRAAVSVWATPRFLMTWRATSNGLEGVASACNSTMLALDEMGEVSGREAGAAAYMLANGAGRARADRTGRARPIARWKTMILSSGEINLADKVAEAGGRVAAGQLVRLLDIPADSFPYGAFAELHGAADGAVFADRMRAATAEHFGTAGPAFVEALMSGREEALAEVRAAITGFEALAARRQRLANPDGQTARAVARLGLVAAAGELATRLGLTGWPPGTARDAALDVLGLWLTGRGGEGPAEARDAVERVRAFLVAHGETRFEPMQTMPDDRPVANRAGWRDDAMYYISADAWRELHRGSDVRRAARYVHDAGYLGSADGDNLAVRLPARRDGSRPRAYAIRSTILGADHD